MRIVTLLICFSLTSCMVGPKYEPPHTCVPDTWGSECDSEGGSDEAPPIAWWQIFGDPLLDKYIEMAAHFNNQFLAADANICQARALKQTKVADLLPHINVDLIPIRTYFSKNGPLFDLASGGGLPFHIQIPQVLNIYNAVIDVAWEIDLFGKRRHAVDVAIANIGSSIEARNAILLTILAEVAHNYIELRSNQMTGVLIEEYIALLEKNMHVAKAQFESGYNNLLVLEQVEANLAQYAAQLPLICAHIYQNIYALSILTGQLPEALLAELLPLQPLPSLPCTLALGVRSDVLRRRPDVRKAERDLASAVANVGVAVASFFPTFTLFGDFGFQSLHLNNLFQAKSVTWALLGDIHIPLFQGGKLVGNLHASEAQAAAAVYSYQQTALTALYEAESSLAAFKQDLNSVGQLKQAASKYADIAHLTEARYEKGLVAITDWLNAQEQSNLAEQNLLAGETGALLDLVTLYKALGGGFEP